MYIMTYIYDLISYVWVFVPKKIDKVWQGITRLVQLGSFISWMHASVGYIIGPHFPFSNIFSRDQSAQLRSFGDSSSHRCCYGPI